jgi:carbamoyltransferase
MRQHILGISAFYHDSAACIVRDGDIVAAAEEERFSRKKGDARFPQRAVEYCLKAAGITPRELGAVAYYDKPVTTFSRLLQSYLEFPFRSYPSFRRSLPLWINEKLKIPQVIDQRLAGFSGEIYFARHHDSHAASSFFCSPFEEAAILVVDGVGEWACTSIGKGCGNRIDVLKQVNFPHSLGLFYSAFTQYLGFKVNLDEYKVMGLAPYGEPRYVHKLLDHVIDLKEDGSLALNLRYFDYVHGLSMINEKLCALLGRPARAAESRVQQFHMDMAASVQAVTTEAMLRLARTAKELSGSRNLCLAGGVALNCVANGEIYRQSIFRSIYVQPAAGDAGGAIGAALQVWHEVLDHARKPPLRDCMKGAYLGPAIEEEEVARYLDSIGSRYTRYSSHTLARHIARWIAGGYIVGLCRGRMEFGPRALGARSILGDPRDPRNQSRINLKIKYRESFRPFAPAVLEECAREYFDIEIPSPYMLLVMPLKESRQLNRDQNATAAGLDKLQIVRSSVPAVTHVDYSVRLQTVTRGRNAFFYDVVEAFYALTGCPMIVNTSFNLRGEPIVCDHQDAYHCFLMSDIDVLVVGSCVVAKEGVDLNVESHLRGEHSGEPISA